MNSLEFYFTVIVLVSLFVINIVHFWDIKKGLKGYAFTLALAFISFFIYNNFSVKKTLNPIVSFATYIYNIDGEEETEEVILDKVVVDEPIIIPICDYYTHKSKVERNLNELDYLVQNVIANQEFQCGYEWYIMYYDTRRGFSVEAYYTTDGSTGTIETINSQIIRMY